MSTSFFKLGSLGRFHFILPALAIIVTAHAAPVTLWQIGEDADPNSNNYNPAGEFGTESYVVDPAPGRVTRLPVDPSYNAATNPNPDDHYYLSGTYPVGFNGLTSPLTVPNNEPVSAFERAITTGDPSNSIHFLLTPAQSSATSRFRLSFELIYGGIFPTPVNNSENFGLHDITVRFKNAAANTLVMQRPGVIRGTRFIVDIPAASVQALAGANTIEIIRTGPPSPNGITQYILFDFVKMEVESDALADADSDGLPRWWENENRLNDTMASDASSDLDGDTLTALQEYHGGILSSDPNLKDTDNDGANDAAELAANSNPNISDTDGDSLSDASELLIPPTSSPILADTDGDGAPDALEKRVGSNPSSSTSVPTPFAGAIGINFVSFGSKENSVTPNIPAGVVPQLRWNNTVPLRGYSLITTGNADIGSPNAGFITRSDGTIIPGMTMQWSASGVGSNGNDGSPDQKIINSYIQAASGQSTSVTISGIPFANYHVIGYVGGGYDEQVCTASLTGVSNTARPLVTSTTPPHSQWEEILAPTTAVPLHVGNYVRYTGRTASSFTLNLSNVESYGTGIHGIQIIDSTLDADTSGIPDWYEMQYALQPAGPAVASADPDNDGLTNLQEYQRGSNPKKSDTDGDGLADGVESAANSLTVDSDGDGLSDYAEATNPLPSNPNSADSNNDSISDKRAISLGLDPNVSPATIPGANGWMPSYSASPAKWEWKIEPIQLVWDHGIGNASGSNAYSDQDLVSFAVGNTAATNSVNSLAMRLLMANGSLSYQLDSSANEAFSAANNSNNGFSLIDPSNPPIDLKAALGFSNYGSRDISDKLRMKISATRGATNAWIFNFQIDNITRNTTPVARAISQSTAAATVDNGTATWQDFQGATNLPTIRVHPSLKLFITSTSLESTPAFSVYADNDNDGMVNTWEDTYQLNKNSAADATQDADGDGLKNRDEYLAGTNPLLADTDGDGADDRVEREEGSNPLLASIVPTFAGGVASNGTDFNQNGLPDAWEAKYKIQGMDPNADSDGDGATNTTEASWGTDPFNANSKIGMNIQKDSNDAVLSWTKANLKRQRLYQSTTLDTWQPLSIPFTSSGANSNARLVGQFNLAPRAFYTVETLDKDSDGDGVSDWDETLIGSDAYQPNSTHAGLLTLDSSGNVNGSVSGDYASFTNQFKNSLPGSPSGGKMTREQAARFLQQASFGPTLAELDRVQTLGFSAWIDDQITNQPATFQQPAIEEMTRDLRGPQVDLSYNYGGINISGNNTTSAFARAAIGGGDQLRQRVAFALSQILVTSRRDTNLAERPTAMANYYDIFIRHAFGNYRNILGEVTRHPAMGRYLSHVGNQKARPEVNQYPDENYAREVMQLFTIGLWELNTDGSRKLSNTGQLIPTYDNGDITAMARVFTGFWFKDLNWNEGVYGERRTC